MQKETAWPGARFYTPEATGLLETPEFNNKQVWPNTFAHTVYLKTNKQKNIGENRTIKRLEINLFITDKFCAAQNFKLRFFVSRSFEMA